eukprot:scaffold12070_cov1477-Chaetoceros_neogracile.AAC.1
MSGKQKGKYYCIQRLDGTIPREKGKYYCIQRLVGTIPRKTFDKQDLKGHYFTSYDDMFIDAKSSVCLARYVNHSCKPNAVLTKVSNDEGSVKSLWIKAKGNRITPSDEITIDYGKEYKQFFENGKCLCTSCLKKPDESRRSATRESNRKSDT